MPNLRVNTLLQMKLTFTDQKNKRRKQEQESRDIELNTVVGTSLVILQISATHGKIHDVMS